MESRFTGASDAALLREKRHAEVAFSVFYRRHVQAVIGFVRAKGLDAHSAADVVSATFFSALRSRGSYRPVNDTALPWLMTIAARQATDAARRDARQSRVSRRIAQVGLRELTSDDIDRYSAPNADLGRALEGLPADQRNAITKRVVEERDYVDVAAALGVTEATARQRVSRGLLTLRSRMAQDDQEHPDV